MTFDAEFGACWGSTIRSLILRWSPQTVVLPGSSGL